MNKRPRRRRAKRSGKGHRRQSQQLLAKEARELYPSGSAASDSDAEWHASLEERLETEPRRGAPKIRRVKAQTATSANKPIVGSTAGPRLRGRVIAVSSGACRVESAGQRFDCVLPSDLARDQRTAIAIGDQVVFAAHGAGTHRLRQVLDRRTTLSRPDPHNPRLERVIAANIDVAVHVASVVEPDLRPALIDRYLIAIDRGGAEAIICVNKIDLLPSAVERQREIERLASYRDLVTEILPTSAETGEGLNALRNLLAGKIAVFVGHSGVGKSSLLNALDPNLDAAIGRTGGGKGRHTTTRSNLYRLEGDIQVIDTPGIREFGLWQLTADELRGYFPDFEQYATGCRFSDCSHTHEPDCGVRQAVDAGDIVRVRFETYLRILASLESGD